MPRNRLLIMGIGNWLMQDEGVGVHLARHLEGVSLPEGVDVLDGGTGGFHLLEYFEQYPYVILVDATLDGVSPGSIRAIIPRFAADFPQAMSTHDIGLKDLVGALHLTGRLPKIKLYVVSIRSIQEQGIELSSDMDGVLDELTRLIQDDIAVELATEPVAQFA
jgi:hydrogenase maturation protease